MAQTYKLVHVHGIDKVGRVKLFNLVPEGRTRLAADPLNMRSEQSRTDIRKNFYTQRIVSEWNRIPNEVKNCTNVHVFKNNYRTHIRQQMGGQDAHNAGDRRSYTIRQHRQSRKASYGRDGTSHR
jgi:hypothetical protein